MVGLWQGLVREWADLPRKNRVGSLGTDSIYGTNPLEATAVGDRAEPRSRGSSAGPPGGLIGGHSFDLGGCAPDDARPFAPNASTGS